MSAKYTLYGFHVSPFVWLPEALLLCKGLEYDFQLVDMLQGEQKQPEYREISPFGLIPALKTPEGKYLHESLAIALYLEAEHPEIACLPSDNLARAQSLALALIVQTGIIPASSPLIFDKVGWAQISSEERAHKLAILKDKLAIFQQELAKRNKSTNLDFTDCLFFQAWFNICFAEPSLNDAFPELASYYQSLAEHPVFIKIEHCEAVKASRNAMRSLVTK